MEVFSPEPALLFKSGASGWEILILRSRVV